jgi:asparagine N-glycosylation enzyme membrane subunit Stt3
MTAPASRPTLVWLGLAVVAMALLLRSLGFEWVFVDGETVVLPPGDAQYHMRRALYAWTHFPSVLFFDPYINFPGGAAISWPPLFDFVIATVGRVFADSELAFQRLAVWTPPVFGALTLWPVYALGRRLGGTSLGLGAAALLAVLPMSVTYSRVGQLDHHCAVALIGACLLLVLARLVSEERVSISLAAGLTLGRVAILLTWHGSLLYLAFVEVTLWLAAAVTGRRDLYAAQAGSAGVAWIVVAPLVWLFPEPLGGDYSAIALSRLHVLVLAAVAIVSAALWWLEGRSNDRSPISRFAWTAGLGVLVIGILLLLPGPRQGLEPALRFLTLSDGVGHRTGEQLPLFEVFGRHSGRPVWQVWGLLGYAIPLLPFGVVWAAPRERRAMAWVVAGWCLGFGALALMQRRYGNDLGPAAAVGFALIIAEIARRVSRRTGRLPVAAAALGIALLLLLPAHSGSLAKLSSGLQSLGGGRSGDPARRTVAGTLTRFLARVRQLTPETAGYFDTRIEPEYGVVAHANFGHAIQNVARRATPADPFWAFIGRENWDHAFALLGARSERDGLALAEKLRARYVMTHSSADPGTLEGWLHHADGRGVDGWPATGHFRLVTEAAAGNAHFAKSFQVAGRRIAGPRTPAYKLFEVVPGALIEVRARPGEEVVATLNLTTSSRRNIEYEVRASADADGVARLRVAHASQGPAADADVRASGPYRVVVGEQRSAVGVPEAAVRSGSVVVSEAGS